MQDLSLPPPFSSFWGELGPRILVLTMLNWAPRRGGGGGEGTSSGNSNHSSLDDPPMLFLRQSLLSFSCQSWEVFFLGIVYM